MQGNRMDEWFYRIMGEEIGPVTSAELRKRVRAGQLLPETEVRKSGTDRWVCASQLKGLFVTKKPPPVTDEIVIERGPITPSEGVIVTTCDLNQPYQIITPIYFQISNKGVFSNKFRTLKEQYRNALRDRNTTDHVLTLGGIVDAFLGQPASVGETDFEQAFYISILELQRLAVSVQADAVIGLRQDTDLDTADFQFFYMQSYGTAVKMISPS